METTNPDSLAEKPGVDRIESHGGGDVVMDVKHLEQAANEATEVEHSLTVKEAFKTYPMAVVWSALFCLCVVMDGYDSGLITNLYGLPSFQRKYGIPFQGGYIIPAAWQTAFAMSSPVGRVVGGGIQGVVAEMFGRKRTLIGCLVLLTGFIFLTFFAQSNAVLMVGEMLCGIIWGILSSLAPVYASEICPLRLRDLLTAYVNLCWSIGQFIATGVLAGMATNPTEWSYRIPFALQWIWPVIIFTFIFQAPESPYWLVRHGHVQKAEAALRKLIRKTDNIDVKQMLALIQRTNEREQEYAKETGYMDCFRGTNLRRTEICAMAWAIQILSGLSLPFYAVVFFEQAGFPPTQAFNMNVGMTGLGFVGTCTSFFLIPRFGRRTLYFGGLSTLTLLMLLVGVIGIAPNRPAIVNAEAGLLIVWFFIYFLTVGPLAYVIFSETSSTRLRGHTTAIALIAYSTLGIVYNVASPYLINKSEADLGAKTGLVYGAVSVLACIWCYFRLPECKGRTFEELDIMFDRKVPTRQFKDYVL
jgi:sugar porter (SP) family MFS transporter